MAGSVAVLPDNWTLIKRRTMEEVEHTLIVTDFEKEMKICKPGENMESRVFMLGKTPFQIRVYPSGEFNSLQLSKMPNMPNAEIFKNYMPICLVNESNTDVNIDGEIEICNIRKFTWENETLPSASRLGFQKCIFGFLIEKDEISAVLVDGTLIVKVKVKMAHEGFVVMGKDKKEESKSAGEIVAMHTNNIYENMINTDFMLMCEGQNIPCHRLFLMSASPMFAGMMKSGMKEAMEGKTDIKCSFTVGKELFKFIYTGKIEEDILVENVVEFLELGERLGMETLKKFTEDKMLNILNMENMTRFFVAGDRYGAGRIREEAKALSKINLRKTMENPGWENEFGSNKGLIIELLMDLI